MAILLHDTIIQEVKRARGIQREKYYGVTCPVCGEKRYLRLADAKRRENSPCRKCASEAAKQAYIDKYGQHPMEELRNHRMRKPSSLEVSVMELLDRLGIPYAREYKFQDGDKVYYLDLVIMKDHEVIMAIECNGDYWHSFPERQARDEQLASVFPYPILWVGEHDSDVLDRLEGFIKEVGIE